MVRKKFEGITWRMPSLEKYIFFWWESRLKIWSLRLGVGSQLDRGPIHTLKLRPLQNLSWWTVLLSEVHSYIVCKLFYNTWSDLCLVELFWNDSLTEVFTIMLLMFWSFLDMASLNFFYFYFLWYWIWLWFWHSICDATIAFTWLMVSTPLNICITWLMVLSFCATTISLFNYWVHPRLLLQENQFQSDFSLVLMNWRQHIATSTTNLVWSTFWIWFLWMRRIGGISSSRKSQSIGFLKINYFLDLKQFKHFVMRKEQHMLMAPVSEALVWLFKGWVSGFISVSCLCNCQYTHGWSLDDYAFSWDSNTCKITAVTFCDFKIL